MAKIVPLILIALFLTACGSVAQLDSEPEITTLGIVDRTTGTVTWTSGSGTLVEASFNAHGALDSEKPGKIRDPKGGLYVTNHDGVSFTGTVAMAFLVTDNQMKFCGLIDPASVSGENLPPNYQGTYAYVMNVQDNGSGAESDADKVRLQRYDVDSWNALVECGGFDVNPDVVSGNLTVLPAFVE